MKKAMLTSAIVATTVIFSASAFAGCAPGENMVQKDGVRLCQSAFAVTAEYTVHNGSVVAASSYVQRLMPEPELTTASVGTHNDGQARQ
jgi:hypothetical protein